MATELTKNHPSMLGGTEISDGNYLIYDAGLNRFVPTSPATATALAYPVGSIYMNASDSTNPSTLLGFGTWVAFGAGRVLIGEGSDSDDQPTPETVSFTAGDEDGEYNHTLTKDEMPSHSHTSVHGQSSGIGRPTGFYSVSTSVGPNNFGGGTLNDNWGSSTTSSTGGGQSHNNLQPYIVVYMWKRTA
jgi:hypothetical protein